MAAGDVSFQMKTGIAGVGKGSHTQIQDDRYRC
jgi:hypothetical protein